MTRTNLERAVVATETLDKALEKHIASLQKLQGDNPAEIESLISKLISYAESIQGFNQRTIQTKMESAKEHYTKHKDYPDDVVAYIESQLKK